MTNAGSTMVRRRTECSDEIYAQLERILASNSLSLPDRARRFLRYVVSETLEGRSRHLKAYTIACVIFGRKDFDAQADPAVRIEAGRIRRELERYYLMAGPDERVIISIPKGGYVPLFETLEIEEMPARQQQRTVAGADAPPVFEPAVDTRPKRVYNSSLLVGGFVGGMAIAALLLVIFSRQGIEPADTNGALVTVTVEAPAFSASDDDLSTMAHGIMDDVVAKLVRVKGLQVVDPAAETKLSRTKLVVEGSMRKIGHQARLNVRMVRRRDSAVLWAKTYDAELNEGLVVQDRIAEDISTAVSQLHNLGTIAASK